MKNLTVALLFGFNLSLTLLLIGGCGGAGGSQIGDFKRTDLPLDADVRLEKGGVYSETMTKDGLRPDCSGISINSLILEGHEIALKANTVTSNCLIETKDYGELLLKINQVAHSYDILVTPKQEEQFKELVKGG